MDPRPDAMARWRADGADVVRLRDGELGQHAEPAGGVRRPETRPRPSARTCECTCVCVCVRPRLLAASLLFCISAASFMAFSHTLMSSWVSALK